MPSSTASLHQPPDVGHAAELTEPFRQTTAQSHPAEQGAVYSDDRVCDTVRLERLPLTDVLQPAYTHTLLYIYRVNNKQTVGGRPPRYAPVIAYRPVVSRGIVE